MSLQRFLNQASAYTFLMELDIISNVRDRLARYRNYAINVWRDASISAAANGHTKVVVSILQHIKKYYLREWDNIRYPVNLIGAAIRGGHLKTVHAAYNGVQPDGSQRYDMTEIAAESPISLRILVYFKNKRASGMSIPLLNPLVLDAIMGDNIPGLRLLYRWGYDLWTYPISCAAIHDRIRVLKFLVEKHAAEYEQRNSIESPGDIYRTAVPHAPKSSRCAKWLKKLTISQ